MDRNSRAILGLIVGLALWCEVQAQTALTFTAEQVDNGAITYAHSCARCHGLELSGGDFGPPLRGIAFSRRWAGRSAGELLSLMKATMPQGNAETLSNAAYAELLAVIVQALGVQPGSAALPTDVSALTAMLIPGNRNAELSGALAPGVVLPQWPIRPNPIERVTPVTDALLNDPPDGSWLTWRRTLDDIGFSPLGQITKTNVRNLRVAWTLALPPGTNEATPLVHDDVIFVASFGDHIQALDAGTGDELWHYSRKLPQEIGAIHHRNIALYGDKLYFATSDAYMVALEIKTGKVVWERPLGNPKAVSATGGPMVVKGVVMQGMTSGLVPGGPYIVGLDAAMGGALWRFNTIAQPGELNGNSWNDLPRQQRTGGSVWTAGSYDAEQNLAFFGPAPTYDTGPLRNPIQQAGITNDALYTDTTIALDPQTGRLVWHYQHLPNDQWNMDWAFERQIINLPINGKIRRVVITAGKPAIYDALDAGTGEYLFSIDLGVQNFITSIDPKSGAKRIDPKLIPGSGETITFCPYQCGGKNWMPASYDPTTAILYVPLVEACMDLLPVANGEFANLTTGVRWTVRPMPGSDGKYGRLHAINLATRRTVWAARQRAPQTTGVLTTAGGVLFAGALDRWFTAYDAASGASLWKARLSDVANSAPISYMVNDKQYVAIVVGRSHAQPAVFTPLVPEISLPPAGSSAIWVFELPE